MDVRFFFQAEDGIRDLVRSRGLGDVYKRQIEDRAIELCGRYVFKISPFFSLADICSIGTTISTCLLYTSDAANERSSVDLGGRRIIKKKKLIRIIPNSR